MVRGIAPMLVLSLLATACAGAEDSSVEDTSPTAEGGGVRRYLDLHDRSSSGIDLIDFGPDHVVHW
jgi:hypothetical protein